MIRFLQNHPKCRYYAFGISLVLLILLAGCASHGVYHVVKPGQTLYRIAKTYDREEADLAAINGITDPTRLLVGQRIYIPGASKIRKVQPTDPPKAPPAPKVPPPPRKSAKPAVKAADKPAGKTAKTAVKPLAQDAVPGPPPAPGTFVWPVRGEVVGKFGADTGKANKGLEIAVPHGTPVTAAAAGKVIYSNSGIRGYGNLVIIEHADNFFTVYGFNAKNLVNVGSFVGQGEKVALSGTPPEGKTPRLHFEIRKGKTAVNPIFFLP